MGSTSAEKSQRIPVEEPLGRLDLDQSRHYAKVFGSDESTFCGTYDLKDKEAAVYRPLSATDSEIRLIKLKSATAPSDLLSCTLEHYLASNLPTYVALSYCWGKSLETRRSLVNGHDFQINTDLWSALLTLRACGDIQSVPSRSGVWKSIFQNAAKVVVWLGEEADESGQFMETLNRWTKYRSCHDYLGDLACWEAMWREDALRSLGPVPEDQILRLIAKSYSLLLKQINALLQRNYWRRVWVVQEVAVGSRVMVHCGPHSATWDELVTCLRSLQLRKAYYNTSDPVAKAYRGFETIQELRSKISLRRPIPLLRALQESYGSKATDARDKVFALLGLSSDAHQYVPGISYEHTLQDTIFQMTIDAIKTTGSLDLICMQGLTQARDSSRDLRLPTWAPRWLSIGDHPFNDRMVRYPTRQVEQLHSDRARIMWNASSNAHYFDAELLSKNSVLCVEGALVGIIDGLTPAAGLPAWSTLYQTKGLGHQFKAHLHAETLADIYETLSLEEDAESRYDENLKHNFFWCINRDSVSLPSLRSVRDWFDSVSNFNIRGAPLRRWKEDGKFLSKLDLEDAKRNSGINPDKSRNESDRERSVEQALVKIMRNGMRLMTTEEGNIGWAHPLALPNDGVFLLCGCSMAVILRELDGDQEHLKFQVIGDAYVHGIMYGELWQQASELLQRIYLH